MEISIVTFLEVSLAIMPRITLAVHEISQMTQPVGSCITEFKSLKGVIDEYPNEPLSPTVQALGY